MAVDKDHGYLLHITFVGPGVEELIHSATTAVAGQVPSAGSGTPSPASLHQRIWFRLLEAYRI